MKYFAIPSSVSRPAEPTVFPYQTRVTMRSYDLARRIYMEGRDRIVLDPEDTIHFSSSIPHFYEALDGVDREVLLIWRRRG